MNGAADTLQFDIHFWLGKLTSQVSLCEQRCPLIEDQVTSRFYGSRKLQDAAIAAARHATSLEQQLTGPTQQFREVQGSESTEFLQVKPLRLPARVTCRPWCLYITLALVLHKPTLQHVAVP